jgi:hypothetical protein
MNPSNNSESIPTRDLEAIILRIRDVLSCHIEEDDAGQVGKVHVLARTGRSPALIVQDVETTLFGLSGTRIDRSRISVAQIKYEDVSTSLSKRVDLLGIRCNYSQSTVTVQVQMGFGSEEFEGSASGPLAEDMHLATACQAVIDGIRKLLSEPLISMDSVFSIALADKKVIVVVMHVSGLHYDEFISGSFIVTGDEMEAAAKATLDAFNGARLGVNK